MKVVIVGGVAGGATAATRLRRLDEQIQITVFERSGYISYANCGLPYYIGGVIEDKEELTLQTPESIWNRFHIDMKIHHEVTDINVEKKTVTVLNLNSGKVYEESYDKLILSPGAKPVMPNLPGIYNEKIFTLRTVEDTLKIRSFIEEKKPKTAVMVGGGFIGLEVAENLCELGVKVTVVQRPKQLMNNIDYDMATLVHNKLRSKGISLKLGCDVIGFAEKEQLQVLLKDDESIGADMVLMAIGVSPEATLAKKIGLELGIKGSIVVNDKMETSMPDIYAVGDAVQVRHVVTGNDTVISLAGPANKQGRIAADNICGLDSHYKGSMGSSVIKLFDMTVASTGLTEKVAKDAGIDYERVVLSPASHAGYYPGAKLMTMKVVYEKNTLKILGAQIVGYDGVDKRLDVIATAISADMKATELKNLDLAYAPPYSSAKDPVNMAGFIIDNIVTGKVKQFHWDELDKLPIDGSVTLLDTRTEGEYARGHVDGFINIPVDDLRENIENIDKSKVVYVMCQSGLRSYISCRILAGKGFDCYNFSGGYRFYENVMREINLPEVSHPCGMDIHSDTTLATLKYYDKNAETFVTDTVSVKFTETQDKFLNLLDKGDYILDFGCGSGRDTRYFLAKGMKVDATDGSLKMCKNASEYTGIEVKNMLFQELNEVEKYNGIWACSSILHLNKSELIVVLKKMLIALKDNGIIYTSFKYGDYEGERNGRYFTDFTEKQFLNFIRDIDNVKLVEYWITSDARPGRGEEKWLNIILQKNQI